LIPFYFDDIAGPGLSYYLNDNYIDDPGDFVGVVNNPWQTPRQHSSFSDLGKPSSYRSTTEFNFSNNPGYVPGKENSLITFI
jgi:pectate lyase